MLTYILRKSPPLCGEFPVQRSKNAALPELAAALLTKDPVRLFFVPQLSDTEAMLALLASVSVRVSRQGRHITLCAGEPFPHPCDPKEAERLRGSVLLLGPLLARTGEARLLLPGGCAIGSRPIDQHIKGLCALGARFSVEGNTLLARCEGLHGASVTLDFPSVGATENLLLAAVLAKGETHIQNAAREPEVADLCVLLGKMGAKIGGIGTNALHVTGVSALRGACHTPLFDRIAAGTYAAMALATDGDIFLQGAEERELATVVSLLRRMGGEITQTDGGLRIRGKVRFPADAETAPYPGFPTDLQAPLTALCTTVPGISRISERIFENRFLHVPELQRFGAKITLSGGTAEIAGGSPLHGARVTATDLRGGAALVLCGLAAEGETVLAYADPIERGYEDFCGVLSSLGAGISRTDGAYP